MPDSNRTAGELRFEKYLTTQGISGEFEKEHNGKSKRPDYTIEWNGRTIVFDIKDFDEPAGLGKSGAFDPYPRIREKIDQGREKFKSFKEFCCGLVLCNLGNPFVMLEDWHIMLGAMYGDSGFTFPVNTSTGIGDASKMRRTFLGHGKMINWTNTQNTTISAIITLGNIQPDRLRLVEAIRAKDKSIEECQAELERTHLDFDLAREVPRVIVWHNAVARIQFPENLFCGPYDSHFGVAQEESGTFQRLTYRGPLLPAGVQPREQ